MYFYGVFFVWHTSLKRYRVAKKIPHQLETTDLPRHQLAGSSSIIMG
ncbi:hypothetical Protein YC6258_00365 [Gynuella sunshinyii YC6258]|uniref:Uncharacterized protein n=1 Tax=Gynuella sunshinyii YC6258 TaxID=1445510 RepID=A0A0C5UYN1_9GAMM|nr:hypothetical Protein YC6258_00365 [Gynuella sunshinyii YC6258]